jgi:starch synthase
MSKRFLFISQEISPYIQDTLASQTSLQVPKAVNEAGHEVRVFMPRFGTINERRHQLHEVIRLSGMNIVVNDIDQPLIIKVASVPGARMQVYFIDNEEYFKRKTNLFDKDGNFHQDNDERTLFFCKGVLETVKKLGWNPDVIHLKGWMTSLVAVYLKTLMKDDPLFADSKIVFSAFSHNYPLSTPIGQILPAGLAFDGMPASVLSQMEQPTVGSLYELAIDWVDALVLHNDDPHPDWEARARERNIPIFKVDADEAPGAMKKFYEELTFAESETLA